MNGYIALHRKLLDNPVVCKDADHLAIWVWLLLKAAWKESDVLFNGKRITLKPGDLPPISRRTIAKELNVSDSKVQRVLKFFESEHQIEQRVNHQSRLITIVSWDKYQGCEPPAEPRVNHERTTSEPRVNTIEESNKVINTTTTKGGRKRKAKPFIPPTLDEVQAYASERGIRIDVRYFHEYYEVSGWKDAYGNPVKNWKLKLLTWSRREEQNNGNIDRADAEGNRKAEETPDGWDRIFG